VFIGFTILLSDMLLFSLLEPIPGSRCCKSEKSRSNWCVWHNH